MIARTPTRRTDLFLGTLVDCSGSMTAGNNIERAKRLRALVTQLTKRRVAKFGRMIAELARRSLGS